MWLAFIGYLTYLFFMAKNNKEEAGEKTRKRPVWLLMVLVVVGLVLIVWGSDVTVDAA